MKMFLFILILVASITGAIFTVDTSAGTSQSGAFIVSCVFIVSCLVFLFIQSLSSATDSIRKGYNDAKKKKKINSALTTKNEIRHIDLEIFNCLGVYKLYRYGWLA